LSAAVFDSLDPDVARQPASDVRITAHARGNLIERIESSCSNGPSPLLAGIIGLPTAAASHIIGSIMDEAHSPGVARLFLTWIAKN